MAIPVFYDSRMSAANSSVSPSSRKPAEVYADWITRNLAIETLPVQPVSSETLSLAHSPRYVNGVLRGLIENGFGDRCPKIAESLKWTNGSFVSAAQHVYSHNGIACSPTSGFHHAGFDNGGAFCTFNGLMVAAVVLMDQSSTVRIGILDMDFHYGDGTAEIIERLQINDRVTQISGWNDYTRCSPTVVLSEIPDMIHGMNCDILFYQAGADMHIDDPLGGLMNTEQLLERDQIVFNYCRRNELPCVFNLAGGYQVAADRSIPKLLEIHRNTIQAALSALE